MCLLKYTEATINSSYNLLYTNNKKLMIASGGGGGGRGARALIDLILNFNRWKVW